MPVAVGSVPQVTSKRAITSLRDWRVITLAAACGAAGFVIAMLIFGSPWHLPPAWGDIPGWITALATTGLLIGAIITAIYAVRAFREQSKEVADQAKMLHVQSEQLNEQRKINEKQIEVLELQATELSESLAVRKREAEERRRAQASSVFIAETRQESPESLPSVTAFVKNASDQPIYDLELRWHRGSAGYGEPNPEHLGALMPGMQASSTREFPAETNLAVSGAVLTFRDAGGITWMRRPDGGLTEQQ